MSSRAAKDHSQRKRGAQKQPAKSGTQPKQQTSTLDLYLRSAPQPPISKMAPANTRRGRRASDPGSPLLELLRRSPDSEDRPPAGADPPPDPPATDQEDEALESDGADTDGADIPSGQGTAALPSTPQVSSLAPVQPLPAQGPATMPATSAPKPQRAASHTALSPLELPASSAGPSQGSAAAVTLGATALKATDTRGEERDWWSSQSTTGGREDHQVLADGNWSLFLQNMPTKADFKSLIAEVRDACKSEIMAIRQDLQSVAQRIDTVEDDHDQTRTYIKDLHFTISAQHFALCDYQRHLEDLDNRGRRHNIRVRGLTESVRDGDIKNTLESIFNQILGAPATHKIHMDRAHRALRPKDASPLPRDVICCITDYTLKEAIMSKVRELRDIVYEGNYLMLLPDLSWVTLQKRKKLRPLLQTLRDKNIPYRWGFPFSLNARRNGRSATLREADGLDDFCRILDIPVPKLQNWELLPPPPPPPPVWTPVKSHRKKRPQTPSTATASPPGPSALG